MEFQTGLHYTFGMFYVRDSLGKMLAQTKLREPCLAGVCFTKVIAGNGD